MIEASRTALGAAIAGDPRVVILGEDAVAGGPFGLTKGLADRFGTEVVRNTPISESAVMGVAVGLALGGRRPFVDLMFNDFSTLASDQLFNHAAKIHFMSGGRYSVPLVVWTIGGAGTRWGAQHSQRLDGWFTQVPGLKVLAPSSPSAASVAVTAAIADPDPVVVMVDRALLYSRQELHPGGAPWRARTVLSGDRVTIATTGRLVHLAIAAARRVSVAAEVIDLQCLAPVDIEPVVESVKRTAKLMVVHDEAGSGAFASGVAAAVYRRAFFHLDAPIVTLTSPATPVPAAPSLEDAYVIGQDDVCRELCALDRA